jgi:hypothetical protein
MQFKVLACGCHRIRRSGVLESCLVQTSSKGTQGIQTIKGKTWHRLACTIGQSGYLQASIHGRVIRINRIVAHNFITNPDGYPEAQHKNGVRTDNRASNLKWGSPKHNAADRAEHGTTARGARNPNAKLTNGKVCKIRDLRAEGRTLQSLADQFNVSKKLILLVTQKKIWKHVK